MEHSLEHAEAVTALSTGYIDGEDLKIGVESKEKLTLDEMLDLCFLKGLLCSFQPVIRDK
ncbi:MAG: hypothetical protein II256_00910 [Bacteroidales bacterium]|nr:hypothetical protein [Bacteroidales bacterium]